MLQVQVRFGSRAPSLLIRVFFNEVLLIVAGLDDDGMMKVVTRCLPMSSPRIAPAYTSITRVYSIRYASVVINPHAAHQFLWCPASKDRTFGKSKTRDGLIAMPNSCRKKCVECPGSVPGIEDSTKLLYGLKLNHVRCYTTPPWPTYWSKTHWKDLMVAFNPQRQQRQAVKSVILFKKYDFSWMKARTVHTSFHEGAIHFQFTIIRLRFAEWSVVMNFCSVLPPPQ